MRTLVLFSTLLYLTLAEPNGYYHQQYNYKASSASYRNNELQRSNDDEGYYSKDGDLEGQVRPRVNSHNQHSEYVNPKLQHSYAVADRSSSFGQLHAGQGFNQELDQQRAAYGYMGQQHHQAVNTNLREITMRLQEELVRELQRSVYEHHQRASAYGSVITQAQIDADMRALEEEIRRNVTVRLQEALKNHYGNQGVRGGYSYTILDGRLQPTANYNNQELAELTRQIEASLMTELAQQMQTYYHTTVNTQVHSRRNTYRRVNGNYGPAPIPIQQPNPQMYPPIHHPHPMPQPHPQPVHIPVHVPDSITTIATRVQTELNEHLNKILDDVEKRYFASNSYHHLNNYNFDQILAQLQEELRGNITFHLDDEIKRTYGFSNYASKYSVEDIENLRRQIEHNLMTKLNRDFNKQREKFFQEHVSNTPVFQPHPMPQPHPIPPIRPMPIPANHAYYPVNTFHYQGDIANVQRQLQETLSRQLQSALMQQSYRQAHMYSGSNFNPEAHYQATLEQLSEELNRNLTRQMEQLYSNHQYQQSGTYQAQLANMRNQLQLELQRQLQQGLQQSFSRYSSWSSSSRTASSNYRPVRGFDPNLYRNYVPPGNVAIVGEDCMMGDDPKTSQQRKKRSFLNEDQDLTQQVETSDEDSTETHAALTQQNQALENQDLLQQTETINGQRIPAFPTHADLTQQAQTNQDLTQQVEDPDLTQQVQTYDSLRNPIQPQRTRVQNQDLTQQIQTDNILNKAHGLTQSTDDIDSHRSTPSVTPYRYYTPIYRRRYQTPYYSQSGNTNTVGERVQYYENLMAPYRTSPGRPYYPANTPLGQQTQDLNQQTQTLNGPQSNSPYRQYTIPNNNQQRPFLNQQQNQPLRQQVEDTDLNQQTLDKSQPRSQYREFTTPDTANQQRPFSVQKPIQLSQPLGQQVEDTDLTQQTLDEPQPNSQYRQYTNPDGNNQQRPFSIEPLGQQVEDTDLTQQTINEPKFNSQYRQYNTPNLNDQYRPLPIQKPIQLGQPLGQQVEDTDDLTQQTQNEPQLSTTQYTTTLRPLQPLQHTQGNHQYHQFPPYPQTSFSPYPQTSFSPQSQQLGQQTEDLSLNQQTLNQPDARRVYEREPNRQIPSQNQQLGQQTEDVDLDQLSDNPQLTQDSSHNRNYFGHYITRPSRRGYIASNDQSSEPIQTQPYQPPQTYLGQTQDQTEDLTQPGEQANNQNYRQFRPLHHRQIQPQQNFLGQTQQKNDDLAQVENYKPLRPWDQQTRPSQPSQVDVFGQTQQTEDDDFAKPPQQDLIQKPLAQLHSHQVDDVDITQQTQDELIGKLTQHHKQQREPLTRPQSQQVEDVDLTQQTEDDYLAKLTRQQQERREPLTRPQYQQVEDLTQQTEDDFLAKFTHKQPEQVEDLNLTQQSEVDDFAKQGLTQQTEDVEQPIESQTATDNKLQTSQQLTQQAEEFDPSSQKLIQQTQDLIRDQINQGQQQEIEEGNINQDNQRLIDLLKNHGKKRQQNEDPVDTASPSPRRPPYYNNPGPSGRSLINRPSNNVNYAQVVEQEEESNTETVKDVEPIEHQVASEVEQVTPQDSVDTASPSPRRPPYHYYPGPSGRSLINRPSSNVNYAKVVEEEGNSTEAVEDIEPIEHQVASEVEQVDTKGSVKTEEPVAPQESDTEVVTTPKPGFWSKLGTSIKNKVTEYKEKIG